MACSLNNLHFEKNVSGVEIALYAAEDKRSIQTSMQNIMRNLFEPKSQAKKYGRYCPNASKGTIDNPDMNWTKMYLKPVLEYVSYEYPQFKKMTNPNLVKRSKRISYDGEFEMYVH